MGPTFLDKFLAFFIYVLSLSQFTDHLWEIWIFDCFK